MTATLSLPTSKVVTLYDAVISAAKGDYANLHTTLQTMVEGREGCCVGWSLVELVRQLRHTISALLRGDGDDPSTTLQLLEAVDRLFDHTTTELTTACAEQQRKQIREHEFITLRLAAATATADRYATQLHCLSAMTQQLSTTLSEDAIAELLVTYLYQLTSVEQITIWVIDPTTATPCLLRHSDTSSVPSERLLISPKQVEQLVQLTFQSAQAQFTIRPGVSAEHLHIQPVCGALALPMRADNQILGVVVLQDSTTISQLYLQQDLIQAVITHITIVLQSRRQQVELQTLRAELARYTPRS
jgi:transcriptional regulator with GAF, ATPase, and Fis domain